MKRLGLLAALLLICTSAQAAARLSAVGVGIQDQNAKAITLKGTSFGLGTASVIQAQDPAALLAMGANTVRFEFPWYNSADGLNDDCATVSNQNAYSPGNPGNIDPAALTRLDAQVTTATAAGLWVDIAIHGGDEGSGCFFYSSGAVQAQFNVMWAYLASHYASTDFMGLYEILVEPHPKAPYTQTDVTNITTAAVTALRANDAAVMVGIGPVKAYDSRYIANVTLPSNSVGIVNFYELSKYVQQAAPPTLSYPGTFGDDKGELGPCAYPNRGNTSAPLNAAFLAGLFQCPVQWSLATGHPFVVDQFGVPTSTPGALQWDKDVTAIFNANHANYIFWVYRKAYKAGSGYVDGGDNGLIWQDSALAWHPKPDFIAALTAAFQYTAPPATLFGTTCTPDAGSEPCHSVTTSSAAATTFGVSVERIRVPFTSNASKIALVSAALAAGHKVQINVGVDCAADAPTYTAELATLRGQIAATGAAVFVYVIGNEEDSGSCTIAQYLANLHTAIAYFHSTGDKVTDSGLTYHSIAYAYDYALQKCTGLGTSQCTPNAASDAFGFLAFQSDPTYNSIPNTCSPTRGFLNGQATAIARMQFTQAFIADVNSADFLNEHLYKLGPAQAQQMSAWWAAQSPHPLAVNETGTESQSGIDVANQLAVLTGLNARLIVWFVPDGTGGGDAIGLLNADNSVRPNGYAFQRYVASAPGATGTTLGGAQAFPGLSC